MEFLMDMSRMQREQPACVNAPVYYAFEYMQKKPQWHM